MTSFIELRNIVVDTMIRKDDFKNPEMTFEMKGSAGVYIVMQNKEGWAIHLGMDGTWFLEDTSGG